MSVEIKKIDPSEFGLEENKALQIQEAFKPSIEERKAISVIYKDLITKPITEELSKDAGDLRKKLVKVRTGISNIHKSQKAFFLAAGRFVDAWKNKETTPILQMEDNLKEIENHFEILKQKEIEKISESRKSELQKYEVEQIPPNIGVLEDSIWQSYLAGVKLQFEQKKEAERIAEEERVAKEKAEKEEQERKRLEYEQKRKEDEEKLRKLEEERRVEAEKIRKEREAHEKQLRKERQEKEKIAAILKAEKDAEAARIKAEKDAEAARIKAEKEAERKAKNAPDKEKLLAFSQSIKDLKRPDLKTEESTSIMKDIEVLFGKLTNFIEEKAKSL